MLESMKPVENANSDLCLNESNLDTLLNDLTSIDQDIFTAYKQPFAVTYLGASLMIVYLPIAFLKDWLCRYLDQRSSKTNKVPALIDDSSVEIGSPLRHKIIEMGLQGTMNKKDSEENLSSHEEDVRPLIGKGKEETQTLKHGKEITTKQIAIYGLYLAPIWFVTEVCFL